MTIDKISINNFGNLSDLVIEPTSGLNVIYAPNESGKTTLLSFVKFIFYGTRQKKAKGDITFKDKYMPWNGMAMSGSIEFTHVGKKYIIYRSEGAKNGTKKLEVKELLTGQLCNITDPGHHFFSVGEKAFSDSCFVTDISSVTDSDDDIISLLANSNVDTVSYGRIKSILEEKILSLSSPKRSSSRLSVLNRQLADDRAKLVSVQNELDFVKKQAQSMRKSQLSLRAELSELENTISQADNEGLYSQLSDLIAQQQNELANYEALSAEIADLGDKFSDSPPKSGSGKKIALYSSLFLVFALLSIVGLIFKLHHAVPVIFTLTALVCLAFGVKLRFGGDNVQNDASNALQDALKRQTAASQNRLDDIRCAISRFESAHPDIIERKNPNIKQINTFTKQELNGIIDKKEKCAFELRKVEMRAASNDERYSELSVEAEALRFSIDNLSLQISQVNSRLEVYRTALSVLETAFSKLRDEFAPRLCANAFELLSAVSDNGECTALVSNESFQASVKINNEYKDVKALSSGTRDLVYLALRTALCEYMSASGSIPMFLDDVLAAFDDERCSRMLRALDALSGSRQIFLCTCRSRETVIVNTGKNASLISIVNNAGKS